MGVESENNLVNPEFTGGIGVEMNGNSLRVEWDRQEFIIRSENSYQQGLLWNVLSDAKGDNALSPETIEDLEGKTVVFCSGTQLPMIDLEKGEPSFLVKAIRGLSLISAVGTVASSKNITRRNFLAGATSIFGVGLLMSILPNPSNGYENNPIGNARQTWDANVDKVTLVENIQAKFEACKLLFLLKIIKDSKVEEEVIFDSQFGKLTLYQLALALQAFGEDAPDRMLESLCSDLEKNKDLFYSEPGYSHFRIQSISVLDGLKIRSFESENQVIMGRVRKALDLSYLP